MKRPRCPKPGVLDAIAAETLAEAERVEWAPHIAECELCGAYLELIEIAGGALEPLTGWDETLEAGFQRLQARMERQSAQHASSWERLASSVGETWRAVVTALRDAMGAAALAVAPPTHALRGTTESASRETAVDALIETVPDEWPIVRAAIGLMEGRLAPAQLYLMNASRDDRDAQLIRICVVWLARQPVDLIETLNAFCAAHPAETDALAERLAAGPKGLEAVVGMPGDLYVAGLIARLSRESPIKT